MFNCTLSEIDDYLRRAASAHMWLITQLKPSLVDQLRSDFSRMAVNKEKRGSFKPKTKIFT